MSAESTVEDISLYIKDLNNGSSEGTLSLFQDCILDALRLRLESNPASQETLDTCLQIGLRYIPTQSQQLSHGVDAVGLLVQFGAKWDGSTVFQMQRTPFHIISTCSNDRHELLNWMIICSEKKLLNERDSSGCTAVMYAVHNSNLQCLRCLIAYGADLNLGSDIAYHVMTTPLVDAMLAYSSNPSSITRDILTLLLENGVNVNKSCQNGFAPIEYAINCNSIDCVMGLVLHGAQFELSPMWFLAASNRSVEVLEYLLELGVNNTCTDSFGRNALYYAVCTGDINVILYLLQMKVPITTTAKQFFENLTSLPRLSAINDMYMHIQQNPAEWNPCVQAIAQDKIDVVQLLEHYEQHSFQSIEALKCAVRMNSLKMVNYLLSKYKYPFINIEYKYPNQGWHTYHTIITEACTQFSTTFMDYRTLEIVSLLLEHGADPAKQRFHSNYENAFQIAINNEYNELVAQFIRSGFDVDCKLHDFYLGDMLPFELAVIRGNGQAAEMLLHAGCSCGKFNLVNNMSTGINSWTIQRFQMYISPELTSLMREWDVNKNNVKPLQQKCRKLILNQLCPRNLKKITELPLPAEMIRYLCILELYDVIHKRRN